MQPPSELLEGLRQAFNDCDVSQILHLLNGYEEHDLSFCDESHGMQTLLMRLCHLHISNEDRQLICRLLLQPARKMDINAVDIAGRTALCHACIAERTDIIRMIAEDEECDPNKADRDGNTPLIYAVKSRRPEVVDVLIVCFLHRGLDVNHCNKKGGCALSEAEHHCDSAICRLLIHEGHANTSALDKITLPRDVRIWKAPRSPTPEMLLLASPRKKTVKRNTEVLSPLVASSRQKSDVSIVSQGERENTKDLDRDDLESSLSDVQEEPETHDEGYADGYGKLTRKSRKNSTSLPDLRSRVCLVGAGSPSSVCTNSPASSDEAVPRYERRVTQHTLDEISLPQLSEEEEEEEEEDEGPRKRTNSLSLPDLTRVLPSRHITVTKKANGAYVTSRRSHGREDATASDEDDVFDKEDSLASNGLDSSRLKLPHLNLSYQVSSTLPSIKTDSRSGFQARHAVLRSSKPGLLSNGALSGKCAVDKTLKLMGNVGNKVSSPSSTPR